MDEAVPGFLLISGTDLGNDESIIVHGFNQQYDWIRKSSDATAAKAIINQTSIDSKQATEDQGPAYREEA